MTNPLGKQIPHSDVFDPSLLFPIARAQGRGELGLREPLPFAGTDRWTCYELSWLDARGIPQLGIATIEYPASSPMIVESKSLKLFLGSMNFTKFESLEAVREAIREALRGVIGIRDISVTIEPPAEWGAQRVVEPLGECIDSVELSSPAPTRIKTTDVEVEEVLHSNLLRSLCPVTGQPDWGTLVIHYRGKRIDQASLLGYVLAHRSYQGFHEQCCERICSDLLMACAPSILWVGCLYLRRGGIDINPERWIEGSPRPALTGRLPRQ